MKGPALPPSRAWIAYCATCGTIVAAGAGKKDAGGCPMCIGDRGRLRYAWYAIEAPRVIAGAGARLSAKRRRMATGDREIGLSIGGHLGTGIVDDDGPASAGGRR